MATDTTLARAAQFGVSIDALAALAAHIRLETQHLPADPVVRELLAAVAVEALGGEAVSPDDAAPVVGLARTFVHQAAELIDNPGRSGGWEQVDPVLLESIGKLSMAIVGALLAAERLLQDLAHRLATPGATFLDVGTGTGWLAIAVARAHPELTVVGIDVFEPALELARRNVHDAGLDARIDLRLQDAAELDEPDTFDAIWLPLPFLPKPIVPAVLTAAHAALRNGGWLLPGTFAGPPGRLSELLVDLRTVRSGGHPWRPDELVAEIHSAGFTGAREIPRTWQAPARLFAARAGA